VSCSTRALSVVGGLLLTSFTAAAESKKPQLTLRVMPQLGTPSTEFLFVGDLKGGSDSGELYCPTLEWQWGPQDASVQEPECAPFQAGVTRIERRFSISRTFPEGPRTATLALRKGDKLLARASVSFRVTWEKKPPTGTFRDPRQ